MLFKSKSSEFNFHEKAKNHSCGKIFKGCIQDASTKSIIGAIPANYQCIIYQTNNPTSFGTSSIRFNNKHSYNIGPGQYIKQTQHNRWKSQENMNKNGCSPFISKEIRQFNIAKDIPGPGKYDINISINKKFQSSLINKKLGRNQYLAKEVRFKQFRSQNPGPGYYDPKIQNVKTGWTHCFKSEIEKLKYINFNQNPGPCQYDVSIKRKTRQHKKKSDGKGQTNMKDVIKKLIQYGKQNNQQYYYQIPDFLPKYQKIKNSPIFMGNIKDRFGNFSKQYDNLKQLVQIKTPGPGQYEIISEFDNLNKKKIIKNKLKKSRFLTKNI